MKYNNIAKKKVIDFVEDEDSYQALVRMSEAMIKIDAESQTTSETKLFLFAVDQMRAAKDALELAIKELTPMWATVELVEDHWNEGLKDDGK